MEPSGFKILFAVVLGIFFIIGKVESRHRYDRRHGRMSFGGYVLVISVFAVFVLIVHGIYSLWYDWHWEKGPPVYASAEAAAADCCVVNASGQPVDGQTHWEDFLQHTQNNQTARLLLARSDGGAVYVVDELFYDGVLYHYTQNTPYLHQDGSYHIYPYLVCLTYAPTDLYSRKISWVLTDKADLTVDELPGILYAEDAEYTAKTVLSEIDHIF